MTLGIFCSRCEVNRFSGWFSQHTCLVLCLHVMFLRDAFVSCFLMLCLLCYAINAANVCLKLSGSLLPARTLF
jgi:hypothetical protein